MPPDSSLTKAIGPLRQADQLQFFIDDRFALAAPSPRSSRPKPTFSRTVRHGSNRTVGTPWPRARAAAAHLQVPQVGDVDGGLAVANPHTEPRVTGFKPLAARSRVDLPEPEAQQARKFAARSLKLAPLRRR